MMFVFSVMSKSKNLQAVDIINTTAGNKLFPAVVFIYILFLFFQQVGTKFLGALQRLLQFPFFNLGFMTG